jgi:hypothetical protein
MAFSGSEGTIIEIGTAHTLTYAYQEAHPDEVKGYFFGKNKLMSLLSQTGCVGIRVYFGLEGSTPKLVLVGAKGNEDDMTGLILDGGCPSPPETGALNTMNNI